MHMDTTHPHVMISPQRTVSSKKQKALWPLVRRPRSRAPSRCDFCLYTGDGASEQGLETGVPGVRVALDEATDCRTPSIAQACPWHARPRHPTTVTCANTLQAALAQPHAAHHVSSRYRCIQLP